MRQEVLVLRHTTRSRRQPIEVQADFIEAILRLTMPGGLRPFVARLRRLGALAGVKDGAGPSGKKRASKSRRRSKP